jgi:hypothetical protein
MNTDEMNFETRIPAEILSDIVFRLLCDEPIALENLKNSSCFHDFPWAVGQVCGRWRTAFLSHRDLWTSLSLRNPLPDHSAAYLAEMNRRSAIYLERSGQLPLTIAISPKGSIITTWKLLLSCSNRWRKADIILLPSAGVIVSLLERRGRMPILESLTIYKSGSEHHDTFEIAPRLTELNLELYEGCIGTWIRFPWAQLTKLGLTLSHTSLGFVTSNELRAFQLQLQNVEDLQLTNPNLYIPFAGLTGMFPPVRLTRLRSLELSVGLGSVVFSWFDPPFLERLWLDSQYLTGDIFAELDAFREGISSLIDRSSCCIRQLTLEWCFDSM